MSVSGGDPQRKNSAVASISIEANDRSLLRGRDSNSDLKDQNLPCCRYTTPDWLLRFDQRLDVFDIDAE